jgi:hypothetical protein
LTKNDGTPDPEILLHLMQRVRLNHFNDTFGALGTGAFYSLDLAAAGIGAFKPLTTQSRRDGTVCLGELQLELFGSACATSTSIDPDVYASLMSELGVMPELDRTLPITADDGTLPCQDTGTYVDMPPLLVSSVYRTFVSHPSSSTVHTCCPGAAPFYPPIHPPSTTRQPPPHPIEPHHHATQVTIHHCTVCAHVFVPRTPTSRSLYSLLIVLHLACVRSDLC